MKVSPRVAVSAYFDGRAERIQSAVLAGVDRFERAQQQNPEQLAVRLTGQRSSRTFQGLAGLAWLGVGAAGVAAGAMLASSGALLVGGAVAAFATYLGSFSEYNLSQWSRARAWPGGELALGETPAPLSNAQTPLKEVLTRQQQSFPSAHQVVYLAGHGDHRQVGPLHYQDLAHQMQGQKVEHTVLNTCLAGQLEVMTQVAPWSRTILASPQPIPARGLPVEKMFSKESLQLAPEQRVRQWVEQAQGYTPSLVALDGDQFCQQLLPALDQLGHWLCKQDRDDLVETLRASRSPEWSLLHQRVDLGSFLSEVKKRFPSPQSQAAQEAWKQVLLASQNEKTLSFQLRPEAKVVPAGWKAFLDKVDLKSKPWSFW